MSKQTSTVVNEWRHWQHPASGTLVPVFVQRISSRGTAYIVKPNPWAIDAGDARGGWTQQQSVRAADLVDEPKVPECVQRAFITTIGEPVRVIARDEAKAHAQADA